MDKISLIKGLINEEFFDSELYLRESELFKKKIINGEKISLVFKKFSEDENKHILILKKIYNINSNISHRKIISYKRLRNVLRMHLVREKKSIILYKKLMFLAKDKKEADIIKAIIDSEENHLLTIKKYLFFIKWV